jgi:plasmid stabilization system protein ParE
MKSADGLARSVREWLETLDPGQRARATLRFDDPERFVWAYTPGERAGLALADMAAAQREAAMRVVGVAMSERGASEVGTIIELESILGALEREGGRAGWIRRDPERYWFAVFGDPATGAPWSWRVGGHHVAIHVTVADGRVVGCTPSFLGANPAVVPNGPTAGARALTGEETIARTVLANLSPEARSIAVVDPVAPPDIHSGNGARADLRSVPTGIRYDDLTSAARQALERLIRHYLARAPHEVASAEWKRIADAGLEAVTFAWAGPDEPGRGHYYAVRGPRFLIEYDNTQNDANHIHAVWRDLANDWGEDLLAAHYRQSHAPR